VANRLGTNDRAWTRVPALVFPQCSLAAGSVECSRRGTLAHTGTLDRVLAPMPRGRVALARLDDRLGLFAGGEEPEGFHAQLRRRLRRAPSLGGGGLRVPPWAFK
jgi:hypothetical protein